MLLPVKSENFPASCCIFVKPCELLSCAKIIVNLLSKPNVESIHTRGSSSVHEKSYSDNVPTNSLVNCVYFAGIQCL